MEYNQKLEQLLASNDVEPGLAADFMKMTMAGQLTEAQVAAWLVVLRTKALSGKVLASLAVEMRAAAVPFPAVSELKLDTCGTGGDSSSQINVSTLSALLLASMGCKVVKHGNRSVSSASGSADLLEKAGYPLSDEPAMTQKRLVESNFCFLFAPVYHKAMKYAGPVRKQLAIKTVMNMLGPLSNPAQPQVQLIGVYAQDLLDVFAEALLSAGIKAGMVVHSNDGFDEISPFTTTQTRIIQNGQINTYEINPTSLGLENSDPGAIQIESPEQSFEVAKQILNGQHLAGCEIVSMNAAAALLLYRSADSEEKPVDFDQDYRDAFEECRSFLQSGKAAAMLQSWS